MFRRRSERNPAGTRAAGARYEQLRQFLDDARTFNGVDRADVPHMHSRVRADERVFLCVQGAWLIEPYDGSEQQRALPTPRRIDQGEFVVTSTAVFTGTKQIRQWVWSNLVDIDHSERGPWTSIRVSDRPKGFGVLYDRDHQDEIRFSIELAVSSAQGKRNALIHLLADELHVAQMSLGDGNAAFMSA